MAVPQALIVTLCGLVVLSGCLDNQIAEQEGMVSPEFPDPEGLRLETVVEGLDWPISTAVAPDEAGRLWVVEKLGLVRVVSNHTIDPEPALDLRDVVGTGFDEHGLMSMVFHPGPEEARVFVFFTPPSKPGVPDAANVTDEWPHSVAIVEYAYRYPDLPVTNTTNGTVLIEQEQPKQTHKGGDLAFGPDGHLYISIGDGEYGELAQRRDNLIGSVLRIDVSEPGMYRVPPDNPFVGDDHARGEVWIHGLRNPWSISIDDESRTLWLADVGADTREEINRVPLDEPGGNYGWDLLEGDVVRVDHEIDRSRFTDPVYSYQTRGEDEDGRLRCSIIGGFVYRGEAIPELDGAYVFGDLCSEAVYAMKQNADGGWTEKVLVEYQTGIVSIDPGPRGEILIVDHFEGTVKRVIPV